MWHHALEIALSQASLLGVRATAPVVAVCNIGTVMCSSVNLAENLVQHCSTNVCVTHGLVRDRALLGRSQVGLHAPVHAARGTRRAIAMCLLCQRTVASHAPY